MPLAKTSRGNLWYADHRTENGIPLLLIHGAGATHLDYPAELRRMNSIAPDLPGHGRSPGSGHDDVAEYAADMVALLDALDIPQAIIAGHSMGGAITQTLALNYPGCVKGVILLATAGVLPVNDAILNGVLTDTRATLELIVKWCWSKTTPDELKQNSLAQLLKTAPKVTHGDYLACSRFDVRDRLIEIQVPVLVIGGTVDKMTPPAWQEALAQALPDATLHLIEGAGHMVMLEKPADVAASVQKWLAAH